MQMQAALGAPSLSMAAATAAAAAFPLAASGLLISNALSLPGGGLGIPGSSAMLANTMSLGLLPGMAGRMESLGGAMPVAKRQKVCVLLVVHATGNQDLHCVRLVVGL